MSLRKRSENVMAEISPLWRRNECSVRRVAGKRLIQALRPTTFESVEIVNLANAQDCKFETETPTGRVRLERRAGNLAGQQVEYHRELIRMTSLGDWTAYSAQCDAQK